MDAGEVLVWARFGTFVPGDHEEVSQRKVISGMADWMFRKLTGFPCNSKSIHGDYLPLPYRALGKDGQTSALNHFIRLLTDWQKRKRSLKYAAAAAGGGDIVLSLT
jgi:hypothetical protein